MRQGYTDGYGWIESGPIKVIACLNELDWLVDVINETTFLKKETL